MYREQHTFECSNCDNFIGSSGYEDAEEIAEECQWVKDQSKPLSFKAWLCPVCQKVRRLEQMNEAATVARGEYK